MESLHSQLGNRLPALVLNSSNKSTLMAILGQQNDLTEKFYLTGYETISFNQPRSFSIETIMDSVVPFEREVLVISSHPSAYKKWSKKHNVNAFIIEQSDGDNLSFRLFLQPEISHVIITIDSSKTEELENLREIGLICESEKVDLIIDCIGTPLPLTTMQQVNAAFFIYENEIGESSIIAKRSRLVQTEGMSRSFMYDLYAYWQKALSKRAHGIEPMAV